MEQEHNGHAAHAGCTFTTFLMQNTPQSLEWLGYWRGFSALLPVVYDTLYFQAASRGAL